MHQIFLQPLARAAAELAAFFFFDLLEFFLQQIVHHCAGQDLVLAAGGQPDGVAQPMRQGFGIGTAERRHETARRQFKRTDRLERAFGEAGVEVGEVQRSWEAEEGQVSKKHCVSG